MWKNIDEKIVSVKSYCLSSKIIEGKILGQQSLTKSFGFIEIESESGKKGYAESYAGVYVTDLISHTVEFLKKKLIGKKIGDLNLFNDLNNIPLIARNGLIKSVIGSLENGIWDLRGRILNKPVVKLIKQERDKIKCYASGGSISMNKVQIEEEIEQILKKEFKAYKMRVGFQSWKNDLERVSKAKAKLGKSELMIDAIMGTIVPGWNLKEAKMKINNLKDFKPTWIEEPLHPSKLKEYFELKKNISIPIAAGEAYSGKLEFDYIIDNNLVDFLQFDCTHSGGLEFCKELSSKSKKKKIKNAIHVWGSPLALSSNLNLALSLDNLSFLEYPHIKFEISNYLENKHITFKNGFASLDDTPGFGVEISDKIKEKFNFVKGTDFNLKR